MFKWYRLSLWISTTKWHYNRGKCVLPHNSHILYRTFKNLMSTRSLDCVESCDKGHAHSCKFAKCHKPTFSNSSQAISLICMKLRTQHLWTLLTKSFFFFFFSSSIFQTILKLSNNNFLHISFQSGSLAYLHIGASEWHQTQFTTSPWAPEARCKFLADYH